MDRTADDYQSVVSQLVAAVWGRGWLYYAIIASVLAPLLREVEAMRRRCPGRPIIVVLSELAGGRWWEAVLHTRRTQRLRTQLLRHGGPDVSVLVVPWQLDAPETEEVIAEEEPQAA